MSTFNDFPHKKIGEFEARSQMFTQTEAFLVS